MNDLEKVTIVIGFGIMVALGGGVCVQFLDRRIKTVARAEHEWYTHGPKTPAMDWEAKADAERLKLAEAIASALDSRKVRA